MPYQRSISAVLLLLLLPISQFNAAAQSQSRSKLKNEISSLRKQLLDKEKLLLEATEEERAPFVEFLKKSNTGLVWLIPRMEHGDTILTINGGGAYYSFIRETHEYGYGADIELLFTQVERWDYTGFRASRRWFDREYQGPQYKETQELCFSVGFAGVDYGFLVDLGKVPLDQVTLEHKGVKYLADYVPASAESEARVESLRSRSGFGKAGFGYKNTLPVRQNDTYVLRSIDYGRSDLLVALHVVRTEGDGRALLLWKRLKRYSTPKLERRDPPKCQP